jgi:hypothetical protein
VRPPRAVLAREDRSPDGREADLPVQATCVALTLQLVRLAAGGYLRSTKVPQLACALRLQMYGMKRPSPRELGTRSILDAKAAGAKKRLAGAGGAHPFLQLAG